MKNLELLRDRLEVQNHPGVAVVQAALDCTSSSDFVKSLAMAMAQAAKADKEEEKGLLDSLTKAAPSAKPRKPRKKKKAPEASEAIEAPEASETM